MKFRLSAFGLHLLGSCCALTLVLGSMYLGWYRWPGWYLSSVLHVVSVVVVVDLVLGPTLTLIVANVKKPRRELTRDIGVIVSVQLVALIYGAVTLWMGRPLYYAFSSDFMQLVQASDLKHDDISKGREENPKLAPYWYSRPRWIWAPLPKDTTSAVSIVQGAIFGGTDVVEMPRYFKPWDQGLSALREQLKPIEDNKYLDLPAKQRIKLRMSGQGLSTGARNTIIVWGDARRLVAVVDPATLKVQAFLNPD